MKRLLLSFFIVYFCIHLQAAELHVGPGGYSSIQDAIDDANNGDSVIVHPGIYYENINFPGEAITLTSLDPNDPNIVSSTVIDGSLPADVNKGSVVTFNSGEGNDSVLSGFTITGGTGSWLVIAWDLHEPYWNRCGGGIVCYNMSQPTITKNVIIDNTAGEGGGIYVYGNPVDINSPSNPPVHLQPVISYNTIVNNDANEDHSFMPPDNNYTFAEHGDGGAIVCFQGVDANICGNLIQNNHADFYGGGLHLRQWSNGIIKDNLIKNNKSRLGAGIHITYSSGPTVSENTISHNQASSLGGGGVYVYYLSNPVIERNLITQNSSLNGAGVGAYYQSNPTIRNNLIIDNKTGAGVRIVGGTLAAISHNTIVGNTASPLSGGGIEYVSSAVSTIENNIIAQNGQAHGIYVSQGQALPLVRYNNVWANPAGNYNSVIGEQTGINGNISIDPHFLDQEVNDYSLNYDSPCINAGDPNFVLGLFEKDFNGDNRLLHGKTDIGADELPPVHNITTTREYATIQSAIMDADNGDEIFAIPGRYEENINFQDKSITLRSLNPFDWDCVRKTIITSAQNDMPVVSFGGTEDANCILSGFTITDANNSGPGGGVLGNGTNATLSWCQISNNTASSGAGIYDFDGLVTNCIITQNNSILHGGGLYQCDGDIYNCIIANNFAGASGGGLSNCDANIINNTVVSNVSSGIGGGLVSCHGNIANSIVWDNNAPYSPAMYDYSEPQYCCLQTSGTGPGNIFLEPQFVDQNDELYNLSIYSDCIDAGNNGIYSPGLYEDIDGEPRIFSFGSDANYIIDIGADEVTTKNADFDEDGFISYDDLDTFIDSWLYSGSSLPTDLVMDGNIDFSDYSEFADGWFWKAPWYSPDRESALQFDRNSGGYVWIHTPQGNILNNVFTFTWTAWIFPTAFSDHMSRIIGKNERAFTIGIGGVLRGYSNGAGTGTSSSTVGTLKTNEWQFVVMTYDWTGDGKVYLYVNGQEVSYQSQLVGTYSGPPLPDWKTEGEWDLIIGSKAWNPGTLIPDAIIDEVAIYNRILTQDEINYLYNNGFGRPAPVLMNPIGLWHFDENQGTVVTDSSGNGNNGILNGTSIPIWTDGKFLRY
jgi:parallel beta-helix repeat protein